MNYVPPWQTPLDVALASERTSALTYGLVSTELAEAAWPDQGFPERLVKRVGTRNLQDTARAFAPDRDDPHEQRDDPETLARHAGRLHELVERQLLPVVAPILSAASESQRLIGTAKGRTPDVPARVRRFITVYGPRVPEPRHLSRGGQVRWGRTFSHLFDRAALEIFELYATQARLRRCTHCGSVFVPRRDEHQCRWNLWRWPSRLNDSAFRYCSESRRAAVEHSRRELSTAEAHRRQRKRLWARTYRERAVARRAGKDPATSERVAVAERALAEYLAEAGVRRGRKAFGTDEADIVPIAD